MMKSISTVEAILGLAGTGSLPVTVTCIWIIFKLFTRVLSNSNFQTPDQFSNNVTCLLPYSFVIQHN